MKWLHPNRSRIATFTAVCSVVIAGCRNQPGALPNPFLAPDRVPPPSTRTLQPGQAQPYYPGDPLPVMQSANPPASPSVSTGKVAMPQPPVANSSLARSSPGVAAPTSPGIASSGSLPTGTPDMNRLAWSNEPAVAIPTDADSLRFPLSMPSAEPMSARASSSVQAQPAMQLAAAPAQTVLPASYTVPAMSGPSAEPSRPSDLTTQATAANPWRSPEIPAPSLSGTIGAPPNPFPAAPAMLPLNSIDVRLRAVPSPAPVPGDSTTPRIRLPSYAAPQPMSAVGVATPPTAFYPTASPPAYYTITTAQISPMSPPPPVSVANLPASPGMVISPDGFRPRGSTR
jgi:hypothetical protein